MTARRSSGGGTMRDKVRKRAEEREQQGGGGFKYDLPDNVNFFQAKKGTMHLDILPYVVTQKTNPEAGPGEQWYQRTVWVHFGIGADDKAYLCPKTLNKKCPICENRSQLMKDSNADSDTIAALKAKERELFNVVDLDDEAKGVQLWEFSYHLFGKMLEEELREGKEEWGSFAELKNGYTLRLRFSEKQLGKNKFLEVSRIDFESREDYPDSVLDQVLDLDEILNVMDYKQLEKVFYELEDEDINKETAEETPPEEETRSRSSSLRGTRREEKESEEPEHRGERKSRASESTNGDKCPQGGEIGKDFGEFDECDNECDIWDKCDEMHADLRRSKRTVRK